MLNQFILPSALPESLFYHTPLKTDCSQSSSFLEVKIFSFALCDILPIFKCTLYRILNLSITLINYFLNLFTNFNL